MVNRQYPGSLNPCACMDASSVLRMHWIKGGLAAFSHPYLVSACPPSGCMCNCQPRVRWLPPQPIQGLCVGRRATANKGLSQLTQPSRCPRERVTSFLDGEAGQGYGVSGTVDGIEPIPRRQGGGKRQDYAQTMTSRACQLLHCLIGLHLPNIRSKITLLIVSRQ